MRTRISSKGQVVLPQPIRRRLGLHAGDELEAEVREQAIVLTPRRKRQPKARIIRDEITGLPVLTAGKDAPVLTSEDVEEMLSDFP
jgi:AbrB family looped-hinge helix DNA binding protein